MESVGERSYAFSTEAKLVSRTPALAAPTLNHTTEPTLQMDISLEVLANSAFPALTFLNGHIALKE